MREKMALKLISERVRQTGYLTFCFVLLLYTLSGLMFQGSMWLLAGVFCWFGIVSSFFVSNIYRYNKRRLLEISLKTEKPNSKKDESDKSNLGFRFLPWWTAIMRKLMIINKMRTKQKKLCRHHSPLIWVDENLNWIHILVSYLKEK